MKKKHPNLGSNLDDLLAADGVLDEVNAAALKRVVALQIKDEMRRRKITKSALARRMHTSRMAVRRSSRLEPRFGCFFFMVCSS